MPAISVVMPVYNHAASCGTALASILEQTLDDLEVIAVDDGSTDCSLAELRRVAGLDPRVRILAAPHGGIVQALTLGVAAASAPLIARMDADDWSHPERLARQAAFLQADARVGAVDCQAELSASEVTGGGMRDYVSHLGVLVGWESIRNSLFEESPLVHPATLMRRHALDEAGGYLEESWPEDYSLWLRMVAAGFRLARLPVPLFRWADPPGRLTRTSALCAPERLAALRARFLPVLHPRVATAGCQLWGMGPTGKVALAALQREGVRVERAFDVDPRKVGNRVSGVRILPLEALKEHRGLLTLVVLGTRPAKAQALAHMRQSDWRPWEDFLLFS